MNNYQQNRPDRSPGSDPAVTALLRAVYAAPAGDSYWRSLEERVMARIQESAPVAWWAVFSEWRNAGLVAATMALVIAGATMVREQQLAEATRQLAAGAAYYTVFDEASGDVSVAFTVPRTADTPAEAPERYLDPLYP